MKYRFTFLNIPAWLFLVYCTIRTIVDYDGLATGEGWGLLYMFAMFLIGIVALFTDLLFQTFIRDRKALNIACIFAVLVFIATIVFR